MSFSSLFSPCGSKEKKTGWGTFNENSFPQIEMKQFLIYCDPYVAGMENCCELREPKCEVNKTFNGTPPPTVTAQLPQMLSQPASPPLDGCRCPAEKKHNSARVQARGGDSALMLGRAPKESLGCNHELRIEAQIESQKHENTLQKVDRIDGLRANVHESDPSEGSRREPRSEPWGTPRTRVKRGRSEAKETQDKR
ncbi:hypothetical protein D4764_11G0008910 [Takifugu flavidus]|uniref:Uncharacterized protein n=1 Tax=Takifugu flavidus TaxID=433684 RepID=A0A5C6PKK5_9TELE|nr:hypothetical protein D4764_11G0008910 [Takifugu flavidus]